MNRPSRLTYWFDKGQMYVRYIRNFYDAVLKRQLSDCQEAYEKFSAYLVFKEMQSSQVGWWTCCPRCAGTDKTKVGRSFKPKSPGPV